MSQTFTGVFDGAVIHPGVPLDFPPNTELEVTVTPKPVAAAPPLSSLDVALGLNLDGPPDWASNLH